MHGGKIWSYKEMEQAKALRAGGLSYGEIGRALDRTESSVSCALLRARDMAGLPYHPYLRDLNGPPIGTDDETIDFRRNARIGSQRLAAEIQRVFG